MGGFGALKIGVKYHDTFTAVAAHSAITNIAQMKMWVEESLDNFSQEDKTEEDVLETILKYKEDLPPFYFDCGTSILFLKTTGFSIRN